MDHAAFVEELHAEIATFTLQIEQAATCDASDEAPDRREWRYPKECYGLQAYPGPGAAIAGIATLIKARAAMPDSLEPRLCGACGLWHIRGIER